MVSITSGIVHFYFPLFVHLNSIIYIPMCRRSWQPTARRRLLWSSTTVTLPHGSGRSGRTADQPKKKGLHRPKRKVFVTNSGGYRQRADREASQSENPTTEKDSFNAENNTAGQYPALRDYIHFKTEKHPARF